MSYCSYLRLKCGKDAYHAMKVNNDTGMPSLRGVEYNIKKFKSNITEGALRDTELLSYLKSKKLPKYVSLSEDATNVTGMLEYSPDSNQIVGLVLPLNKDNAMPEPLSYAAISASAIDTIMVDRSVLISNMLNVVMAQPLALNVPAFCLMVYGGNAKFTAEDVKKRWACIVNRLGSIGINVISISTDSDPRYNSAMKDLMLSCRMIRSSLFPRWFHFDCSDAIYVPVQDTVHIGTKLRNIFLGRNLMFGHHKISVEHLHDLMCSVSRDKHGLYKTHINPQDRMNFISVQKITDSKVTQLLEKHVGGSDGTVIYLKIIDMVLRAFLDMSLSPLERVRNMWYAVFILRIWRASVVKNPGQNLDQNFITSYTYTCIEINAHSLITLILYFKSNDLTHLFLPHLISSQPCESFFRSLRSLTTLGSTTTNFSVLQSIHRCEKMDLMDRIARRNLTSFTFATKNQRSREIYYNTTKYNTAILPTHDEIINVIELAKEDAMLDATALSVEVNRYFDHKCKIKLSTHRTQNIPKMENITARKDGNKLTQFQALHLVDYTDKIDMRTFNKEGPYVAVDDVELDGTGERRIYVRKDALISLYMERCTRLSSDRVKRVHQKGQCEKEGTKPIQSDVIYESSETYFPEWLGLND